MYRRTGHARKQHTYMDYIFKLKYEKKNEKKNKELKYRYE